MTDNPKFELDCKNRKITLKGACLDLLDICKGMCCRKWNVPIQHDEYDTGAYNAKKVCIIDGNNCKNERQYCLSRQYRLNQKEDGSCIYLDEDSKCSIYDRRPTVCKNFTCKTGWEISTTCPAPQPKEADATETAAPAPHKTYETPLDNSMTFLANPLAQLKTLFYAKDKKKLSFVVKPTDKCTFTTCSVDFDYPALNEDVLRRLITLFDGKTTIDAACAALNEKCNLQIPAEDMCRIVRILYHRGILVFKNSE